MTRPTENGYYMIRYLHKDGDVFNKAIWWNGEAFVYRDYVKEVYEYQTKRFGFYTECRFYEGPDENVWVDFHGPNICTYKPRIDEALTTQEIEDFWMERDT
jgi:hypothetical protein